MDGVSPVVEGDAIIDNVTIRVSVCLGSSGSAPEAAEGQDSIKRKRYAARASIVPLFRKRTEMVRRHEVYVSNPYDELSEFPCRYPCQPGQFLPQRL